MTHELGWVPKCQYCQVSPHHLSSSHLELLCASLGPIYNIDILGTMGSVSFHCSPSSLEHPLPTASTSGRQHLQQPHPITWQSRRRRITHQRLSRIHAVQTTEVLPASPPSALRRQVCMSSFSPGQPPNAAPFCQEDIDLDVSVDSGLQKLIDTAGAGASLTSPGWLTQLGRLWGGKSVRTNGPSLSPSCKQAGPCRAATGIMHLHACPFCTRAMRVRSRSCTFPHAPPASRPMQGRERDHARPCMPPLHVGPCRAAIETMHLHACAFRKPGHAGLRFGISHLHACPLCKPGHAGPRSGPCTSMHAHFASRLRQGPEQAACMLAGCAGGGC
jgi:hypothetical protein